MSAVMSAVSLLVEVKVELTLFHFKTVTHIVNHVILALTSLHLLLKRTEVCNKLVNSSGPPSFPPKVQAAKQTVNHGPIGSLRQVY